MSAVHSHFSPVQRLLHWLMSICILAMLFIGVGMVSTINPDHLTLIAIHKPLGLAILMLAVLRIVIRIRLGAPPLPAALPEPMKLAAQLSHYIFYALMLVLPLLGWAMLSAADYPVVVLGTTLPPIAPHSNQLHTLLWDAHRALALFFFALILLHLAAALYHLLVRKDGVFQAMATVSAKDD
jgi:cytochrome b561